MRHIVDEFTRVALILSRYFLFTYQNGQQIFHLKREA